jgi:hypothetical protein
MSQTLKVVYRLTAAWIAANHGLCHIPLNELKAICRLTAARIAEGLEGVGESARDLAALLHEARVAGGGGRGRGGGSCVDNGGGAAAFLANSLELSWLLSPEEVNKDLEQFMVLLGSPGSPSVLASVMVDDASVGAGMLDVARLCSAVVRLVGSAVLPALNIGSQMVWCTCLDRALPSLAAILPSNQHAVQ